VTDLDRSEAFYARILGFNKIVDLSPTRRLYSNGSLVIALSLPPNPALAIANDRFDENRLGLDHLSLAVATRAAMDQAVRLFDECEVSHGEVRDLGEGMNICVLAFRDPDNIQMELTSPRN
jgi:glyoxylase I family protein